MARPKARLQPVTVARAADYPSYERYHAERRQVLRWLGAGGAVAATSGLLGCDAVRDLLGMEGERLSGEVACPHPPTGAGTGTGGVTEAGGLPTETEAESESESETEAGGRPTETEAGGRPTETETEAGGRPTEAEAEIERTVTPDPEESRSEPPRLSGDIAGPEHPAATEESVDARPTRTRGKIRTVNPNPPKE